MLFCFGVGCLGFFPSVLSLPLFPLFSPVIEPFEPFVDDCQISDFQQSIPCVYVAPGSPAPPSSLLLSGSFLHSQRLLAGGKG